MFLFRLSRSNVKTSMYTYIGRGTREDDHPHALTQKVPTCAFRRKSIGHCIYTSRHRNRPCYSSESQEEAPHATHYYKRCNRVKLRLLLGRNWWKHGICFAVKWRQTRTHRPHPIYLASNPPNTLINVHGGVNYFVLIPPPPPPQGAPG